MVNSLKSESPIILFDIDRTLLDSPLFIANMKQLILNRSGLTSDILENLYNKYFESLPSVFYFDFLDLVDFFNLESKIKQSIIKSYKREKSFFPKYSDVDHVLQKLKADGFRLGVFSEGVLRFQKDKIKSMDLESYFDPELIFIGQSKREPVFLKQIPAGSWIVDDNPEVIDLLNNIDGLKPVYLVREDHRLPIKQFENVLTIKSLYELHGLL